MKKQIKWWMSAACGLMSMAVMAQKPATISGKLTMDTNLQIPVKLFKVTEGRLQQIAVCNGNQTGKFGFLFYPDYTGIYVIGIGNTMSAQGNFSFYFKPGDHLNLKMGPWDYALTSPDNTKENLAMYHWHQLTDSIYGKSINFMHGISTYVDFFPQLEATAKKVQSWLQQNKTGNETFDNYMKDYARMDMALIASNFLQTPRTAHPSVEEYSPYYQRLHAKDFTKSTDLIYNYPYGFRTMQALANLDFRTSGRKYEQGMDMIKAFNGYIINDTLKGDMVLNRASGIKDYGQFKEMMDNYGRYILTDSQKVREAAIRQPLLKFKKGDDAYNFSYVDNHGQKTSLSDMKGKVVLVDVWATWCGPCKAQIPYLKQLEAEMKGKDVQFVSISVDELKDKEKWLHYIDTAKLGGTQLFAGGWNQKSGLAQYYEIKGIPRFMVFDKNGKIVSVDAPRPSQPELKALLEKTLAE
ncbi:hypothetical protein GCM10027566_24120 [Arachidicoccus ginsenosidivorans]